MKLLVVDAFAETPFTGNPAAICLLESEKETKWMQSVAAEMNLSETAFVRQIQDGFELRWFTPAVEVDLCGHATLAAAHVLWSEGIISDDARISFHTKSGRLIATRDRGAIELDFPATPAVEVPLPDGLAEALGVQPQFVGKSLYDEFVVVESEQVVRSLKPNFQQLSALSRRGVIVTSKSGNARFDFLSRYFAPAAGINEDPVTGSAHCCLGPFWRDRLGKDTMTAYQASSRGGVVQVRVSGDRVILGGQAVTVFRGELLA